MSRSRRQADVQAPTRAGGHVRYFSEKLMKGKTDASLFFFLDEPWLQLFYGSRPHLVLQNVVYSGCLVVGLFLFPGC